MVQFYVRCRIKTKTFSQSEPIIIYSLKGYYISHMSVTHVDEFHTKLTKNVYCQILTISQLPVSKLIKKCKNKQRNQLLN
jgi:hypothetical protein